MKEALPTDADEMSSFVAALREDLLRNGDKPEWENNTLELFLESLSAVLISHQGHILPRKKMKSLTYHDLADLLLAAKIYE